MSLKPKEIDLDEHLRFIKYNIDEIFNNNGFEQCNWNTFVTYVFNICVARESYPEILYNITNLILKKQVNSIFIRIKNANFILYKDSNDILKIYSNEWEKYLYNIQLINIIYFYFNKNHTNEVNNIRRNDILEKIEKVEKKILTIENLGFQIWQTDIINPLEHVIIDKIIKILWEGDYKTPNIRMNITVKNIINSFIKIHNIDKQLKLYKNILETPYLSKITECYHNLSQEISKDKNISYYMEEVIKIIEYETQKAILYLDKSSVILVLDECRKQLIINYITFFESECMNIIEKEKDPDLKNIYILLKSINQKQIIIDHFQKYLKCNFEQFVLNYIEKPSEIIENLLNEYNKYVNLIKKHFGNDIDFINLLDIIIKYNIENKLHKISLPRLLANYCDLMLKKSKIKISEEVCTQKLNICVKIINYFSDKDIFIKFYEQKLCKRLICKNSISMELEEYVINLLKTHEGLEYTTKISNMYKDITLINDLNSNFHNYIQENNSDIIKCNIQVLNSFSWPCNSDMPSVTLPIEIEKVMTKFDCFYKDNYKNKKLIWLHNICECDVSLTYLPKQYIITMNTYQLSILSRFENENELKFNDLMYYTKMSEEPFKKYIQTLINASLLISNTNELTSDSVISLNMNYSNKRVKIKILNAVQKDTTEEIKKTTQNVTEDRKIYIKALIVRIMKSRKVLNHKQLTQEILNMNTNAKFSIDNKQIKQCIEILIDRDYIKRSPDNNEEYSYIA